MSRRVRVVLMAVVALFAGSLLLHISRTSGPGADRGSAAGPEAGQIISVGAPAYASTGVAANANDADYDSTWTADGSGWIAYDLSSVAPERRRSVAVAWYTSPDDGHSVGPLQGVCPVWSGRPYLSNYTVAVNPALGGGPAPESGWVDVATTTGNTSLSRQEMVAFEGYNWLRLSGSGPNGLSINVDVADASAGSDEGWLFLGDSITAGYAGHVSVADPSGRQVRSLTDLLSEATNGASRPIAENGGTSCARSYDALAWITPMLDSFPGRYVTLNFGTNDGWGGAGDPQAYGVNMGMLVDEVLARGLIPVVPTIPWPNNTGVWQAGVEAMNAEIERLYRERSDVIRGPDLYLLTKGRTELFREPGDVHPNEAGSALIRSAWADAAVVAIAAR